jgi:hypothetical protein
MSWYPLNQVFTTLSMRRHMRLVLRWRAVAGPLKVRIRTQAGDGAERREAPCGHRDTFLPLDFETSPYYFALGLDQHWLSRCLEGSFRT